MISGTTAWARFEVNIDLALVNSIVITYSRRAGGTILQKRYPDDTEYRDGLIWLPLTQQDTSTLRSGGDIVLVELQFNLVSGAVAKSEIKTVCVSDTLATEYVDGSAPDDSQREGGVIEVALDDVIVVQTGGGGIYEETDPTVPGWAKQPEKPKYTASEVGALPSNTQIPKKTSELVNDSNFIRKSELQAGIDAALAQAKASGEFKGDKGDPGYTPVRGTDYWTEEDVESMHAYIDDKIINGEW